MARGIQKNSTAWDSYSKLLDCNLKSVRDLLKNEFKNELRCSNKLDKINIPGKIGSCAPDDGLWFYKNELIAV